MRVGDAVVAGILPVDAFSVTTAFIDGWITSAASETRADNAARQARFECVVVESQLSATQSPKLRV